MGLSLSLWKRNPPPLQGALMEEPVPQGVALGWCPRRWRDGIGNHFISNADLSSNYPTIVSEEDGRLMTTYLLAWNPKRWTWDELAEKSSAVKAGKRTIVRWSCGASRHLQKATELS